MTEDGASKEGKIGSWKENGRSYLHPSATEVKGSLGAGAFLVPTGMGPPSR